MTIHPQLVNISPNKLFSPQNMLIYALCRQLSQVAFTRFCRQIHQSARIGGWGSSQSWQCQDFKRFCYSNPSLRILFQPQECKIDMTVAKLATSTVRLLAEKVRYCYTNFAHIRGS